MKKPLPYFLFYFLTLYSSQTFAQNVWTQKASYPDTGVFLAVGFSIADKGYIGTGLNYWDGTDSFWEYDPSIDSWTQKANFAGGRRAGCYGFSIGSKGYVGIDSAFWEFDPSLNIWTQKSNIHALAYNGFSIGAKGYVFGGDSSEFWEYDPSSDSWTPKANPPQAVFTADPITFSIGSKGYIGTGWNYTNNLWEYDQISNLWTQKANLPAIGRYGAVAFAIGSKGYVGTGQDSLGGWLDDFWEYDTTNSWTQVANFGGGSISEAVGFAIGDNGYVGTGAPSFPPPSTGFWEYSPLVGVKNISIHNFHVVIYPNPLTTVSNLEIISNMNNTSEKISFVMYDLNGNKVKELVISGSHIQIERGDFATGMYIYELSNEKEAIFTGKLIIAD